MKATYIRDSGELIQCDRFVHMFFDIGNDECKRAWGKTCDPRFVALKCVIVAKKMSCENIRNGFDHERLSRMRRAFKFGDQNGRQSANEQIPRVEHVHEFRLSLRIASNLHCSFSQQGSGHADSEAWRKCASPGATVACRRDG